MKQIGKKIAITGGAAEGKSVVLRYLHEQGYAVGSADEVVAELWQDPDFRERVRDELDLPVGFSKDDVRAAIFHDPALRRRLNALVHEPVMEILMDSEAEFFEIPLLVETCTHPWFDRIWVVTAEPNEQRRRLAERGLGEAEIHAILDAQLPSAVKAVFATDVIRTDVDLGDVYRTVEECLAKAKQAS